MAHHTFESGSRTLQMPDERLALLKYFLMLGARQGGERRLFAALSRWTWTGPGEWSNVDERPLVDGAGAFAAAARAVAQLDGVVSRQYIRDNIPELDPSRDWDAKQVLEDLKKLRRHVRPRSNRSGAFWVCIVHFAATVLSIFIGSGAVILYWTWPLWWIANMALKFTHTTSRTVVFMALSALWLVLVPMASMSTMLALGAHM